MLRRFDTPGNPITFDRFCRNQQIRIARRLANGFMSRRPGDQWVLTIRGVKPAQIPLDEPPIMPPQAKNEER